MRSSLIIICLSCVCSYNPTGFASGVATEHLTDEELTLIALRDQLDTFFQNLRALSSDFIQTNSYCDRDSETTKGYICLKRGNTNKARVHFESGKIEDMLLIDKTLIIIDRKKKKKKKYALSASPLLSLLIGQLRVTQLDCSVDISASDFVTFTLSQPGGQKVQMLFTRNKKKLGQWVSWSIHQKCSVVGVQFEHLRLNSKADCSDHKFQLDGVI